MRISSRVVLVSAAAFAVAACSKPADNKDATAAGGLTTDSQKFSYSIGVNIGKQLHNIKDNVDTKSLEAGLEDSFSDAPLKLDDKAREEVMKAMAQKIQQQKMEEQKKLADKNKADGEKFLADNGKKPGVKTTASGLQYEVETDGTGATPGKDDKVTVNYKGTLIDGTVFDSSYDRKDASGNPTPATFPVSGVIPGWTEGLQLMKVGGKYKLYIPSNLGYGEHGAGQKIGPNSTLIFEVELMNVEKADAPKPAVPAPGAKPAAPAAKPAATAAQPSKK